MTEILYRVQSVAGRERPLARLSGRLPVGREVILDHDAADPNPWRGYRRCLENLGDATHVVVLQDDTLACRNFGAAVERIVEARPSTITSLFVGGLQNFNTRVFLRALTARRSWVQLHPMQTGAVIHVCALIWPADLAREFLEWTAANATRLPGHRGVPKSDDAVVSYWAKMTRQEVWATVPSLVEHPDDQPVVAGHRKRADGRDKGRVAIRWIGPDADPLEIDWRAT